MPLWGIFKLPLRLRHNECIPEDEYLSWLAYQTHGSTDPQVWSPSATYSGDETIDRLGWAWDHLAIAQRAVLAPLPQARLAGYIASQQSSICVRRAKALVTLRDLMDYRTGADPDRDADHAVELARRSGHRPTIEVVRAWAATGRRQPIEGLSSVTMPQRTASDYLAAYLRRHGDDPSVRRLEALHGLGRAIRYYLGSDRASWQRWDRDRATDAERDLATVAEAHLFGGFR